MNMDKSADVSMRNDRVVYQCVDVLKLIGSIMVFAMHIGGEMARVSCKMVRSILLYYICLFFL